jgi:hypothetical protein
LIAVNFIQLFKKTVAQNRTIISFLLLFLLSTVVHAQDLGQIGKKDAIKMNGSLSMMNVFYASDGISARRPPSTWFINGNVNFNIYGWSVPLSVTMSQNNTSLNQPFNQYGLSPRYKWVTLHAGYRNMNFSQYTLAGHTFLGGGVELTPKHYKFAAMYGRLLKAVAEDTLSGNGQTPSFERWGWGWKAGYEKDGNGIDVNMFHAQDRVNSIAYIPEQNDVKPGENLVIGLSGKLRVSKQFNVQGEIANSAYTRDTRAEIATGNRSIYANLGNIFTYRTSTSNYSAYKLNGTYTFLKYTLGATYERIQPGYRTMGAYFFNNDMENVTLNLTGRFAKDKLNAGINLGTQRNNLQNTEVNTVRRMIGSINLSYTPNQKWNFNASYSNFQTSTAIAQRVQQYQNADSLRFYQVSQSANGGAGYNFGSKERKKAILLNLAYQIAKNNSSGSGQNGDSKFYNGNLSYKYTIVPKNVGLSIGVNANQSELSTVNTFALGPTASVNKSMFKKTLRSTVSTSYNNLYNNGRNTSRVLNIAFNNNFVYKRKHTLMMNAVIINRESNTANVQKFTEYTCTVGYTFVF